MKIELSFLTEHADLYRDADENLICHLVGVEEADLINGIANYHAEIAKAKAAAEAEDAATKAVTDAAAALQSPEASPVAEA